MNYILDTKNYNLKFFLQLLYCLIPASLITGSFFPDLIVSTISLLFLYHCFKENNFSYFKNKFFLIFFLFYLILILSSLVNNLISNNLIIFYIRFGIFMIATSYLVEFDKKFMNIFTFFIFFTFLILCIDGYVQYFYGTNISGNAYPGIYANDYPRLNSFFGRKYKLGSFIVRLFPFLLFIFLINKKINKFIVLLLLFLLSGIVFLSGERSSFLLLVVMFFFLFFYNKKISIIFLISLFFLFSFFYYFSSSRSQKTRIIDFSSHIFNSKTSNIDLNFQEKDKLILETNGNSNIKIKFMKIIKDPYLLLNNEYKSIYINAFKIFKDNPFIGAGPKSYLLQCQKYDSAACTTHPHQTYLHLLSETGLIGFSFIFFIFFYSLHGYFKNIKKNSYISFIYLGLIINIWPLTSSGSFFNNWLSVIIFLPLGFLLKLKK